MWLESQLRRRDWREHQSSMRGHTKGPLLFCGGFLGAVRPGSQEQSIELSWEDESPGTEAVSKLGETGFT